MSFGEYTIYYKSISVPSIPGQTDVELSLTSRDGHWVISRKLGSMYDHDSIELNVESRAVNRLFESLERLKLPALPDGIIGLDGTTHTLQISNGLNSITYEWWVELPKNLGGLMSILEQLCKMAEINLDILDLDIGWE